ncbi:hypothetical protein BGX27_001790 [Mortierella sp. AM989]|nr:hypothetical protein BGX27_001790 [Mortierella sp. AM989]
MSSNPLLLPDLLQPISRYIEPEDVYNCCLVSKTWYDAFNPLLWRTVIINNRNRPLLISARTHHIRKLVFQGSTLPNYLPTQWSRLEILNIQDNSCSTILNPLWSSVAEIIRESPTLTTIQLHSFQGELAIEVWESIKNAPNVHTLRLESVEFNTQQANMLWSICTVLENLELHACMIPNPQESAADDLRNLPVAFPRMHEIKFVGLKDIPMDQQFLLLQKCPKIRSVCWHGRRVNLFMINNTFPFDTSFLELESLDVKGLTQNNEVNDFIAGNKKPLTKLVVQGCSFSERTVDHLKRHFQTLKELDIKLCTQVESKDIAMLLQSCPLLTSFKAGLLLASDIRRGETWPDELVTLHINIGLQGCNPEVASRRIFECLSKLILLQELNLSGNKRHDKRRSEPLLLQLDYGLDKLSTLRCMTRFYFGEEGQTMTMKEGKWIKRHWRILQVIQGTFNSDLKVNGQIHRLFRDENKRYLHREQRGLILQ